MNEEKILNLWRWFYANELKIRKSIENNLYDEQEVIVQNLDNLVLDIGRFSWDIGPTTTGNWSFTISPNSNKELLAETKEILSMAPTLDNWEFYFAKQARNWDYQLKIYDNEMNLRTIDTLEWNYVAIQEQNNGTRLILQANNINHLDSETANTAAHSFLINEIGEEAIIELIQSVKIVEKLENEQDKQKKPIVQLKKYIAKIGNLL